MRPGRNGARRWFWLWSLGWALVVLLASPPLQAGDGGLLGQRQPSRVQGVRDAALLTDGVRAEEGEDWGSPAAARFESARAFVEYDLGKLTPITAALVQG